MKPPAAAIVASSPGRDKFPPVPAPSGLARLFGGGRRRGRPSASARSSPVFVSRSRSVGRSAAAAQTPARGAAAEVGEPSSPKVTCIGQVRMRGNQRPASYTSSSAVASKKVPSSSKKVAAGGASLMPCRCLHKAFMCSLFPSAKKKPKDRPHDSRQSLWRYWSSLSGSKSGGSAAAAGGCGDGCHTQKLDPVRLRPELFPRTNEAEVHRIKEEEDNEEEIGEASEQDDRTRIFVSSSAAATPPKNALLLMRCRSAPHNCASAVATSRFAASPLPLLFESPAAELRLEEIAGLSVLEREEEEEEEWKKRKSRDEGTTSPPPADAAAEDEEEEEEEEEGMASESQRPLVLARSKSEPARVAAAKLAAPPESAAAGSHCFWKNGSGSSRWPRRRWGLLAEEGTPPHALVPLSVHQF